MIGCFFSLFVLPSLMLEVPVICHTARQHSVMARDACVPSCIIDSLLFISSKTCTFSGWESPRSPPSSSTSSYCIEEIFTG